MKYAREGAFQKKGPLPRAPSRKDDGAGEFRGGRFSKRSASPGPPPEEWLGFELVLPSNNMPLKVECGSLFVGCGHGG